MKLSEIREIAEISQPQKAVIVTMTRGKYPENLSKYPKGIYLRRELRVLLNFEKDESVLATVGPHYFQRKDWQKPFQGSETVCVCDNKPDHYYLRFMVIEIVSERFYSDNKQIGREDSLKLLPKRGQPDYRRPVYMAVDFENIRSVILEEE